MNDKQQILTTLREEFTRWEELLASLSEQQITAPLLPSHWSIKDEIAHLRAWQQRSIARLQAALLNRAPEFPTWPAGLDPESEEDTTLINAWIYEAFRDQPWSSVHRDWREGFLRFLELGEAIPEKDLLEPGRYAWLGEYRLAIVLTSSYEHHEEHLDRLLAWLRQHGNTQIAG
jgi:hypothetical protein